MDRDWGALNRIFEAVVAEPDLEWVMLDASVIRAHARAAEAEQRYCASLDDTAMAARLKPNGLRQTRGGSHREMREADDQPAGSEPT